LSAPLVTRAGSLYITQGKVYLRLSKHLLERPLSHQGGLIIYHANTRWLIIYHAGQSVLASFQARGGGCFSRVYATTWLSISVSAIAVPLPLSLFLLNPRSTREVPLPCDMTTVAGVFRWAKDSAPFSTQQRVFLREPSLTALRCSQSQRLPWRLRPLDRLAFQQFADYLAKWHRARRGFDCVARGTGSSSSVFLSSSSSSSSSSS